MAELVGAFAASHAPLIARDWHLLPAATRDRLAAALRELGRRVEALKPDVIVEVAPDHWVNFFINNLPTVCIGVGEEHEGPPEPFLKDFPHKDMKGHPELAHHILKTALDRDFEPSVSHHMKLDHGFCIPLMRMELKKLPRMIPIVINSLEFPMPSLRRCVAWGKLIAEAVASYPENLRVVVLTTGGLSHSIGEATMGDIDEGLDLRTIEAFKREPESKLSSFLDKELETAGNGTHEVRNWLVAHGAAGGRGFELVDYLPVPEVYVGCAFASWNLAQNSAR
jgi:aromatic ring-opening dioxygenase catalytic subunit (LigB family)